MQATVILEDGTILKGESCGVKGTQVGEIVFNTSMTGYQEILTDPSYAGQIIVMTYPEIGNYGLNKDDFEAENSYCRGFIAKNFCKNESHYKSEKNLRQYFMEKNIMAIEGLDTRSLTKKIREAGAMKCLITTDEISEADIASKIAILKNYTPNKDIVSEVTSAQSYVIGKSKDIRIAMIDYGCKKGIPESLANRGCEVTVFPANTAADAILNKNFDCVFLSNGPGDPADCTLQLRTIKNLIGQIPIFGICLGYQLLAIALGAKTYKLKYGHRGGNHPVMNLKTNKVMMTSQNHGYAVEAESLTSIMQATYKNLNDDTMEGFLSDSLKIYAVQFHPESAPGPLDSCGIFDEWISKMKKFKEEKEAPVRKAADILNA